MTSSGHLISPAIAAELVRFRLQLQPFLIAAAVWNRLFLESERAKLGGNPGAAYAKCQGTVGMWMKVRGGTYERGILEIQYGLDRISEQKFRELLAAIGEAAPQLPPSGTPQPSWDGDACNLYFDGELVRYLQGRSRARNVALILDGFEAEGWPQFMENPLPRETDLNETIRSLNRGLELIRFRSTGEGIAWAPVTPKAQSRR